MLLVQKNFVNTKFSELYIRGLDNGSSQYLSKQLSDCGYFSWPWDIIAHCRFVFGKIIAA